MLSNLPPSVISVYAEIPTFAVFANGDLIDLFIVTFSLLANISIVLVHVLPVSCCDMSLYLSMFYPCHAVTYV